MSWISPCPDPPDQPGPDRLSRSTRPALPDEVGDVLEGRIGGRPDRPPGPIRCSCRPRGVVHFRKSRWCPFVILPQQLLHLVVDRASTFAQNLVPFDSVGAARARHQPLPLAKAPLRSSGSSQSAAAGMRTNHRYRPRRDGRHSNPSIDIARPHPSAESAAHRGAFVTTRMPCALNSSTCSCGLCPAVSTIFTPLSMIALRYSA